MPAGCVRAAAAVHDAGRERREGTSGAGARILFSRAAATGDRLSDTRAFAVSRRPRGGTRDHRVLCPQRQSRELVFIAHPLDNGLIAWDRVIARLAREFGVADRVLSLPGGTPPELLRNAAGIVTINSTIGITALHAGVPVKALGNAVFDVPGLTCQEPLDRFWKSPPAPDPDLMAAFLRALVGTTQVKGGYYEPASQSSAIAGFIDRLENRPYPLRD